MHFCLCPRPRSRLITSDFTGRLHLGSYLASSGVTNKQASNCNYININPIEQLVPSPSRRDYLQSTCTSQEPGISSSQNHVLKSEATASLAVHLVLKGSISITKSLPITSQLCSVHYSRPREATRKILQNGIILLDLPPRHRALLRCSLLLSWDLYCFVARIGCSIKLSFLIVDETNYVIVKHYGKIENMNPPEETDQAKEKNGQGHSPNVAGQHPTSNEAENDLDEDNDNNVPDTTSHDTPESATWKNLRKDCECDNVTSDNGMASGSRELTEHEKYPSLKALGISHRQRSFEMDDNSWYYRKEDSGKVLPRSDVKHPAAIMKSSGPTSFRVQISSPESPEDSDKSKPKNDSGITDVASSLASASNVIGYDWSCVGSSKLPAEETKIDKESESDEEDRSVKSDSEIIMFKTRTPRDSISVTMSKALNLAKLHLDKQFTWDEFEYPEQTEDETTFHWTPPTASAISHTNDKMPTPNTSHQLLIEVKHHNDTGIFTQLPSIGSESLESEDPPGIKPDNVSLSVSHSALRSTSRDSEAKKSVIFADSVGLDLALVHPVPNTNSPPQVPDSAFASLVIDDLPRPKEIATKYMSACFNQPGADPSFVQKVQVKKVCLENVLITDMTITGLVRVANLSKKMHVYATYSHNSWYSSVMVPATYLPNSSDGPTQRFSFVFEAPSTLEPGSDLELAVYLVAEGSTFCDNNEGNKYFFHCFHKDTSVDYIDEVLEL